MNRSDESLRRIVAQIRPADRASAEAVCRAFDGKTKPRGSLGELEGLASRIASIRRTTDLRPLQGAILVAAGDHGFASERVSAYPREVTGQMLRNFAAGGAAVNVLARENGARLLVIDAGVATSFEHPLIRRLSLGPGTENATRGPAMRREQALAGLADGVDLALELADEGVELVALGDMGIGNTTSASALCAALLPTDATAVCGRGTGIDDEGLERKIDAVRRALTVNEPDPGDPVSVLAAVGGFEIAVLTGVCLGAASRSLVVLLDGFVTGAAALVAARLCPVVVESMVASHRSPEPGHALTLAALGLRPLVDLGLRLGEGSGAALVLPLVNASLALLADMSTFAEAGVAEAHA